MKIREIEKSDLSRLGSLIVEHADYEGLPIESSPHTKQLGKLIFSDTPVLFVWVVEMEKELLGYMSATIDYSTWQAAPFVHLDCLYLKEQVRGQGIGFLLMKQLREFAQHQNCNNIQWQTPPTNILGISFYRKIGAVELSKMRFTWPVDMQKTHEAPSFSSTK